MTLMAVLRSGRWAPWLFQRWHVLQPWQPSLMGAATADHQGAARVENRRTRPRPRRSPRSRLEHYCRSRRGSPRPRDRARTLSRSGCPEAAWKGCTPGSSRPLVPLRYWTRSAGVRRNRASCNTMQVCRFLLRVTTGSVFRTNHSRSPRRSTGHIDQTAVPWCSSRA